jgi:hypothetical protein
MSMIRTRVRRAGASWVPPDGPLRQIALGTLASAVGSGAWYTSWAIFLTRSVGLTAGDVGIGLTAAGLAGVLAATPIGRLSDRVGARPTFLVLLVAQALASFAYTTVGGMTAFMVVAGFAQIASSATGGPRNALVLELAGERDRLAVLGQLRAISHIGWALGAALGGVVITVNTRPAYLALLALNGASYLVYAALLSRTSPGSRPARTRTPHQPPRLGVLHDRPYVTLAALMGLLALCWAMLSTGLPLWVTLHTHAPRAISAAIVLVSSLAIAALQVPANRVSTSPRQAARAAVLAGAALAASCLLFALTAGGRGLAVVVLMLAAAVLHITGELLFVAASWGLSVPLMPAGSHGEYQGIFAAGEATALMAAPALMTTLIAGWGQPGWIALAAVFLVPAAAAIPATRWALRTRGPEPAPAGAGARPG